MAASGPMSLFAHPQVLAWRDRLVPVELGMGWAPFVSLSYIVFLFLPVLVPRIAAAAWLPMTLLATLVFLPMYFRAYWAQGRETVLLAIAMSVLAMALAPLNPFSNTFVIFACAFAPYLASLRNALLLALGVTAGFSLFVLARVGMGAPLTVGITYLVGAACFVGSYFMRENQRKQVALRLSHEEVRRLAALAERERIGRDLHDLLGHTLSLITLKSELANRLWDRDPHAARQEVREVERIARDALSQVRRAVTGIRAAGLAAEMVSAKLLLESAGVAFHYELDCEPPPAVETGLALAVREAVTNIHRHAQATRVTARLVPEDGGLLLDVQDNGCGGDIVPGNGLSGMRERLRALGAELRVDSLRGQGTRLCVRVPQTCLVATGDESVRAH